MLDSYIMDSRFLSPYKPEEHEGRLYMKWNDQGLFDPDTLVKKGYTLPGAEPFAIVLPPPNVTGTLHMGHAAMLVIEDIIVRFQRMRGKRTVWLPGTDHAAIATQSKVEKLIDKEEKKSKYDLGRDEFLIRVEKFAQDSHDTIVSQVRAMGASVDWSREAFTLDDKRSLAVRTAFTMMYEDGLIYRGHRIVNWDPKGQTTISDDEIVYEERMATLYTFRYWKDFPISISTTRPETKVGDTAVAVHPDDPRYKEFVGKVYTGEFCGVPLSITIVADESVEKDFGTGALGVTPAHSQIDWEIADRHDLHRPQVIDERARMMVGKEDLLGKKVSEARTVIVNWLRESGLLESEAEVKQNVSTAERTGAIIEPLPKLQWFIDVEKPFAMKGDGIRGIKKGDMVTLKEVMTKAVESGAITILPDRFTKIYKNWIDNLRPWCISRQIWYGHRVPVWYRKTATTHASPGAEEDIFVGITSPSGEDWVQDSDTLDTWFSSGLWTFSTLGWPDKNAPDLKTYHPTALLETGYDILFFWVARMVLMTGYCLGDIPFRTVYLHGLVRDEKGRKMSKSLGNIIDPLDMNAKYGADATRISLIIGAGPGADTNLSEEKIRGYKKFANKLWNIARFIIEKTEDLPNDTLTSASLTATDLAIVDDFHAVSAEVTDHIAAYRLHLAGESLYHYIWHTLADVIIEESKPSLAGEDLALKRSRQLLLRTILEGSLKLLHPFMPFVTEAIWETLGKERMLIVTPWPERPTK